MSFCYILLHVCVYLTVGLSMLLLPGISAAGVSNDRRSGRLEDLITTPFSSAAIYFGKVIAAALPFCAAGGFVFVLMLPIMFAERLDAVSVLRILVEMICQVALIAIVSVTSSCLCRHAATARVLAYTGVWVVVPLLWYGVLTVGSIQATGHFDMVDSETIGLNGNSSQAIWTWEQLSNYMILYLFLIAVLAASIGVRRLYPRGKVKKTPRASISETSAPPINLGQTPTSGG